MRRFWIGADPGGKGAFGLAFLDDAGVLSCETVSSVDQAVQKIKKIISSGELLGMGIDAPMWWSAREGGDRLVDKSLRTQYNIRSGTVQTHNSLRGAALVGGALLASRVRQVFSRVRITESHPKALLQALGVTGEELAEMYKIPKGWQNEHERDAMIAAVCAREGFEGRWHTNLAEKRYPSEQDTREYWLKPMYYFWPERICAESARSECA